MQVKDPVCGMVVEDSDAAATVKHAGRTYYFCSKDCAETFTDDPEDYL